jgi:2-hydroxyglutarate dehydrogenase
VIYFDCQKGLRAIHSPHTGIVDWGYVARHFGKTFRERGGQIVLNFEADKFEASPNPEYPLRIVSTQNVILQNKESSLLTY